MEIINTDYNQRPKNPRSNANFISYIFYGWVISTFKKGFFQSFDTDDLYQVEKNQRSEILGDKLEKEWLIEQQKDKPSLFRALFKVFGNEFILLGIWLFYIESVKILQPIILYFLLEYYVTTRPSHVSTTQAYICTGLLVLTIINWVLNLHTNVFALQLLGMKVRVACCSLLFRKCLKLSLKAMEQTTVGQLVNLISNDVNRFDTAFIHLQYLVMAPLSLPVIFYLMYYYLGASQFVGISYIMVFVPIQIYVGKLFSVLRLKTAIKTDERVRLMNEIISGVKVIKMYTWEQPFANLVKKARKAEIKQIRMNSTIRGLLYAYAVFTSRFAVFITILSYVLMGYVPDASYIFVTSAFFNLLRQTMTVNLLYAIAQYAEVAVSVRRLQNFLLYEEIKTEMQSCDADNVGVTISEATAQWTNSGFENTLSDINLEIASGELVTIIGSVGSGKTSLLVLILKELPLIHGNLEVRGILSYASQEPWLFCGSVRENIIFGREFDLARYNAVIEACALRRDFCLFPHGDSTAIGEKGAMLSGGQRARINLARAIYKVADIYLLDDPLSAVDTRVGKHIFEECILGLLKGKTILLVTHQIQFLRNCPKIIMLHHGQIVYQGNYDDLTKSTQAEFALVLEKVDDSENANGDVKLDTSCDEESNALERKPDLDKEQITFGVINNKVYMAYILAGGGNCCVVAMVVILFFVTQLAMSSSDYFQTFWVNTEQKRKDKAIHESLSSPRQCVVIYSVLILFVVFITTTRNISFFSFCMNASTRLHNHMFEKLVRAPMLFFNRNPSGRILNRFSKDMGVIDEQLPLVLLDTMQVGLQVLGILIIIIFIQPWLIIPIITTLVVFYLLRIVYLRTSRNVKRLEGTTRSPVFTLLNAALQGLATIRASEAQKSLRKEFDNYQNLHSSAWFMFITTSRAFGFWLDLICALNTAFVAFSFIIVGKESYGGNVGLAITQAISLTGLFQWGMRQWSEMETQMTSVERVVEYTNIEQERMLNSDKAPEDWPKDGHIQFVETSLRYAPNDQLVLKDLSFVVQPKEKIGIVGRTGAGKSSLIASLFQLVVTEGSIIIDGYDIGEVSLQKLRSSLSIIPQEPVLFSGTLRKNLDPFDEYLDTQLWLALENVELKEAVQNLPNGLESRMSEGGTNFSVGQRQLVCLARAILRANKILVMDEATANVDPQTDALIQYTIKENFKDCTVLTIAHRINTIIHCDKVLVIDAGELKEFDHPYVLLQNTVGVFYGMVQHTGKTMSGTLNMIAKENYEINHIIEQVDN